MEQFNNMIEEQTFLIKQSFNMLGIKDATYILDKSTPHNLSLCYYEYAPYDLYLEEQCCYGLRCFYKNEPLVCSKNHQSLQYIIKQNTLIPKELCKYERPWKYLRCNNIYCWYSHLYGRSEHINNLKLIYNIEDA